MKSYEFARAIGESLACTGRNMVVKSSAEVQASLVDHEAFDRWVLRIGETAFKEAGLIGSIGHSLCKAAASATVWGPQFSELADTVVAALGRECELQKAAEMDLHFAPFTEQEEKRAGMNWLSALLAGSASKAPEVGKLIAGGAMLAGGAGGSLTWLANRSVKEDDDDIEAMKAKINTYRRLTEDIENELAIRNQKSQAFA